MAYKENFNLEPCPTRELISRYGHDEIKFMSPLERLQEINEIALDWDGYRDAKNLGELLDEIRMICIMPYENKEND